MKSVMKHQFNRLELSGDETSVENEKKIIKFIRQNNRVYLSADSAGSGKSYRFLLAFDKDKDRTLFVTPTNKLCVKYKNLGFHTKTLYSFLCLDKNGNHRNPTTEEAILYANLKYLVIDEIFCMSIDHIQAIEFWIREHPHIKIYCTGDRLQLENINPLLNADQIKYESQFVEKNLMKLYPNNIHFTQIQRCRNADGTRDMIGVARMERLKEEIFDESKEWDVERVQYIVRDFKKCTFGEIRTKHNICYLNGTCDELNTRLISLYGGIKIGMRLVCKVRLDLPKQDVTCYVNYEYVITAISDDEYELFEELDEKTFTITKKQYASHFKVNYTLTNHSLQGSTMPSEYGEITLLDIFKVNRFGKLLINRNFLYVALTRCERLDNLIICEDNTDFKIRGLLEKIEGHKRTDIEKGCYDASLHIDEKYFYNLVHKQQYCCCVCQVPLLFEYDNSNAGTSYSINRILNKDDEGNHIGHWKGYVNVTCLSCNLSDKFPWREANKEFFEFKLDEQM